MSVAPMVSAKDIGRGFSIFEIDESLGAIVEAAETEAEANNGEISEGVKAELATYAAAFGHKVDRITDYLKAQRAEAEIAQREARSVSTSVQSRGEPGGAQTDARMVHGDPQRPEIAG